MRISEGANLRSTRRGLPVLVSSNHDDTIIIYGGAIDPRNLEQSRQIEAGQLNLAYYSILAPGVGKLGEGNDVPQGFRSVFGCSLGPSRN